MELRIVLKFLLLVAVIGVVKGFLTDVEFQTIIKPRCYNRTYDHKRLVNGQHVPLGNSMETFIDLLEGFERNYTFSRERIIELFLTRFRVDGVTERQEDIFMQNLDDKSRLELIRNIIKPNTKLSDFPEEAYTEEQKCALYYMMSHSIVNDQEKHFIPTEIPDGKPTFQAIEQGVVTLKNNRIHSIALGKVLLGILAGLKNGQKQPVKNILGEIGKLPHSLPEQIQLEGEIDPLYGVTIGDTISAEVLRTVNETDKFTKTRKFGPNGMWNSTMCPSKYVLTKPATYATYGEIRGAGDGFILGFQVRELQKKNIKIPISTILRMYYSSRGIPSTGTYSYCRRWDNWGEFNDQALEQIHYYSRLMNIAIRGSSFNDKNLHEGAKEASSEFTNSRDEIIDSITKNEECFNQDTDVHSSLETISDVFVVLDTRGNEPDIWTRQKAIVSKLATSLDIRYFGGRFNVFANARGPRNLVLEPVVINATSSGCIGCKLDWYYSGYSQVDETYVLESLLEMLKTYESDRLHSPGVPGRTIVYFNFGKTLNRDRKFKNAYWELTNKHRDVQILAIGSSTDVLNQLATDNEKVMIENDVEQIVNNLEDEIRKSPEILQYKDCDDKPSRLDESVYQGYITPKRIQYWSMFPEFFLKSFDIKFQFKAKNGKIRVCHSRDKKRVSDNCQETSSPDDILNVYISNPCKGKTVYNCKPFHFSIEGKETGSQDANCFEKECKYFDQIKFQINHEGVSCNGSVGLLSSLALTILSLLYLMKIYK